MWSLHQGLPKASCFPKKTVDPVVQRSARFFSSKSQTVNISGFASHMISVAKTQLCHYSVKKMSWMVLARWLMSEGLKQMMPLSPPKRM